MIITNDNTSKSKFKLTESEREALRQEVNFNLELAKQEDGLSIDEFEAIEELEHLAELEAELKKEGLNL